MLQKTLQNSLENNLLVVKKFSEISFGLLQQLEQKIIETGIHHMNQYKNHQQDLIQSDVFHKNRLDEIKNHLITNFETILMDAFNKEKEEYFRLTTEMNKSLSNSVQSLKESNRDTLMITSQMKQDGEAFTSNFSNSQKEISESHTKGIKNLKESLEGDKENFSEFATIQLNGDKEIQENLTSFGNEIQGKLSQETKEMINFKSTQETIQQEHVKLISYQLGNVTTKTEEEKKKNDDFLKKVQDNTNLNDTRVNSLVKRYQNYVDGGLSENQTLCDSLKKNSNHEAPSKRIVNLPTQFTRSKDEQILEKEFQSQHPPAIIVKEEEEEKSVESVEIEETLKDSDEVLFKMEPVAPQQVANILHKKPTNQKLQIAKVQRRIPPTQEERKIQSNSLKTKRQSDVGVYSQNKKRKMEKENQNPYL
jgi:hypothetical protein